MADLSRVLESHLTMWRGAVSHLPPTLLLADPFLPDFGSAKVVTDVLARAPQVEIMFRGQSSAPASSFRSRRLSTRRSSTRPAAALLLPQRYGRFRPYNIRPDRSSTAPDIGEGRPSQTRHVSSSRRKVRGPFVLRHWLNEGARR